MSGLRFTIPGAPVGKGRPRFTRGGRAYTPAATQSAETLIGHLARQAAEGVILDPPIALDVRAYVTPPTKWHKADRVAAIATANHAAGRPDLDNIVKLIADALNGVVWRDDADVARITAARVYAAVARTDVSIRSMAPETPNLEHLA